VLDEQERERGRKISREGGEAKQVLPQVLPPKEEREMTEKVASVV
jgi:hypothetical protein